MGACIEQSDHSDVDPRSVPQRDMGKVGIARREFDMIDKIRSRCRTSVRRKAHGARVPAYPRLSAYYDRIV
jgi:hypothetical protein